MKRTILIISLIVPFLFGCKKETPDSREFPIIRTLDVVDIDSTGATFQGELVKKGTRPTTTYGFVWDANVPDIDRSYTVVLGNNINSSSFNVRIDHSLAKGLEYNVRAFATQESKRVYGNTIKIISKGGANSAWSLEKADIKIDGQGTTYGSSTDVAGFIIFQTWGVYFYNPETNEISRSTNFPLPGDYATQFTSVSIGNIQYVFNSKDCNIYKFQSESWTKLSQAPFYYGDNINYYEFSVSDNIFFLGLGLSYMYNIKTNIWQRLTNIPVYYPYHSIGGTHINNKAYIITSDKNIWEYNTDNDTWTNKTSYPGIVYGKIISFSYNGKLYCGLSYHNNLEYYNWFDREFWIYDPLLNKWSRTQQFPMDLINGNIFFFSIKNKLYIGHQDDKTYNIWKFDPAKI